MIVIKKVRVTTDSEVAIVCDDCKTKYDRRDAWDECQEFLRWSNRGGYGSIFGDGEEMTLDLCQHCVKKRLGDVIQHHGNAYL